MNYPKDIESRLGYSEIKNRIKDCCSGDAGKNYIDQLMFRTKIDEINERLSLASDVQSIIGGGQSLPLNEYDNVEVFIKNLAIKGFYLHAEDLAKLRKFLNIAENCIRFINDKSLHIEYLKSYFENVSLNISLISKIDNTVDETGHIKSTASKELAQIRKDLLKEEERLRGTASKFILWGQKQNFIDDDIHPTILNGRMVVPIFSEFKRKVDGLVHDESSTGQTVYFEPSELIGINNEVKDLLHRERREIVRILLEVSDLLLEEKDSLKEALEFLTELDGLNAIALFSNNINGVKPQLIQDPAFKWQNAKHPHLAVLFKQKGEDIVPFDFVLNEDKKFLIISGPNAGGKSVCLTAIGLIQYMLQLGIPVPMDKRSTAGIFRKLYLDIGDQQSVDNDLSTYSAHLSNMNYFLENAQPGTLVLMDEYGTGTDPTIGGALAETMLDELLKKGAHGVVTTHYSMIKKMAESHEQVENGAMLFDGDSLKPTFQLETGRAGSSYAFELARKIGINKKLINEAKGKVGELADYDKILMRLETENRKLKEKMKDLENMDSSLKKSFSELTDISDHLKIRKEEIIEEAKREAARIIKNANRDVEAAVREIKESKADKEVSKEVRDRLGRKIEELNKPSTGKKDNTEYKVGDFVKIKNSNTVGEILDISGNTLRIKSGNFISQVKREMVVVSEKKDDSTIRRKGYLTSFDKSEFKNSIDIRGVRVTEALAQVDKFLDKALLFGEKEIRILHGKGNGTLRSAIRDYISKYDYIESYENEADDRGGDGITVIYL